MMARRSPLVDLSGMTAVKLRVRQGDSFGAFAVEMAKPFRSPSPGDDALAAEWRRLAAEELLLARLCGMAVHQTWYEGLADVPPFAGDAEPLSSAVERVAWVATIPVIRGWPSTTGAFVRLWGLHGDDDAARVEGALPPIQEGPFTLRLGGWDHVIAGNSWQLGAALAMRAAVEERRDLQLALARDWIVTGEVRGAWVEGVQVGNKVLTHTNSRQWLVPEDNHQEFGGYLGRVRACSTLDAAWSQLSGEGSLGHGMVSWPEREDVEELHATMSQAVRPILASILLTRPERLVLWHSSDYQFSKKHADFLEDFLADERVCAWPGWEGRCPRVKKRLLPENDLVEGEKALVAEGLHLAGRKTILFNITGGNLIMRLAIHNVARLNPRLWLIYRELGIANPVEVILIRNAGRLPSTGRMLPAETPDGINWGFSKNGGPSPSTESLLTEVFSSALPSYAVTHPGPYHADDVVAGAILRLRHGESFPIRRSENPDVIAAADIVFDVGGEWDPRRGRFDHHQGPTESHPCGTPYASAGLLWARYGLEIVARECPDVGESEIKLIAEAVRQICILPVDAWDNGIFPDFRGQRVLVFQAFLNASAHGADPDKGYEISLALAMRALAGFIGQRAETLNRESALTAVIAGTASEPALLRDQKSDFWLLSRSLRFPLKETCDFLATAGITLRGLIQPNLSGREGKWMVLSHDPIPQLPDECFRSRNQLLVILPDLVPALNSLELDASTMETQALD